jgi:hypothetical protein
VKGGTQAELRRLADEFETESRDDLVGLWEIVGDVEVLTDDEETMREHTLEVVRELLSLAV